MDFLQQLIDLFLHLDVHLSAVIAQYGITTYIILFGIVFAETGLVFIPFLPGDSLLFAAGTFAGTGVLRNDMLLILFSVAAIIGDTVNYWLGKSIGARAFSGRIPFLKREYLEKTEQFYEKHGSKTIILARFIPIIRTFAPFVAGLGNMNYVRFLTYNIVGGLLWVFLFVEAGYFFGQVPVVKENFEYVIIAIIAISLLPGVFEYLKHRKQRKA